MTLYVIFSPYKWCLEGLCPGKSRPDHSASPGQTTTPEPQRCGLGLQIHPQKCPVVCSLRRSKSHFSFSGDVAEGFCLLAAALPPQQSSVSWPWAWKPSWASPGPDVPLPTPQLAPWPSWAAHCQHLCPSCLGLRGASGAAGRQTSPSLHPPPWSIPVIYATPGFSSCLLCGEPDGFSVCLGACLSTLFLLLTVVLAAAPH